jgi:hypothetical protein
MENDVAFARNIQTLQKSAQFNRRGEFMGGLHLESSASAVARNLTAIDDLLKESPDAAKTEGSDHDALELLRNKVRGVADVERAELNLFNGTIQTGQMYVLMHAGDQYGVASNGWTGPQADPTTPFTSMVTPIQPLGAARLTDAAVRGAAVIVQREREFTQALLPLAAQCQPAPVPAAPSSPTP